MIPSYKIANNFKIGNNLQIMDGAILGKAFRPYLDGSFEEIKEVGVIQDNVYVGYNTIIGQGGKIAQNVIIDDLCIIENAVIIGAKTLVIYRSQICSNVEIGANCVIGGFIGEGSKIGNNCRVFGSIVHAQNEPTNPWDDDSSMEESPHILDNSFVGFNAVVSAPITIGPRAYICAGSVVTRNVPEGFIAHGTNQLTHYKKWKGKLASSKFFES